MQGKPVVIGVAGGSSSGKTTVAKAICERLGHQSIVLIEQDAYYKDQSQLPFEERLKVNYDHPLAFDTELLIEHLQKLIRYEPIDMPVYDYKAYTRSTADRKSVV